MSETTTPPRDDKPLCRCGYSWQQHEAGTQAVVACHEYRPWQYSFAPAPLDAGRATETADPYVPGDWVCPTCGFIQSMRTMNAHSGNVGVSHERALPCPNDGEYLVRLTWKRHAENVTAVATAALDSETALRARLDASERVRVAAERVLSCYAGSFNASLDPAMDALRASLAPTPEGMRCE
jgi:hypothetical protein